MYEDCGIYVPTFFDFVSICGINLFCLFCKNVLLTLTQVIIQPYCACNHHIILNIIMSVLLSLLLLSHKSQIFHYIISSSSLVPL